MNSPEAPVPSLPLAGGYSTKRHRASLRDCESEPIQTPGCIQSHGVLAAVRMADRTILQVSENTLEHLGLAPEQLLGQPIARILGPAGAELMGIVLAREPVERNPFRLMTLPERYPARSFEVSVHTVDGVAVLEFEPAGRADGRPERDFSGLLRKSVLRLQAAESVADCGDLIVREMRALTGMDRVLLYRFHADAHGEVAAEAKREQLPSWLQLHYPAADIPAAARAIFLEIGIRPVPNAAGRLAEMVPLLNPATGKALPMTHCALRAPSALYTEYLHNLGSAASLTLPIIREGTLWGLIACHHGMPAEFSYQMRAAAEFLARTASLQLRAADDRELLRRHRRRDEMQHRLFLKVIEKKTLATLVDGDSPLLESMAAGGAAFFHGGRWHQLGRTPAEPQLEELRQWLEGCPEFVSPLSPVFASAALAERFGPAAGYREIAAGLLAVPVGRKNGAVLCWFRPEEVRTIYWAGAADEKIEAGGSAAAGIAPRKSFVPVPETIRGQSAPWLPASVEEALRLRLLIAEVTLNLLPETTGSTGD